jgi:hypothetical protein
VSLWQYRYTFCHESAGKRTPQPWCCCYHFVADDTVESLISFTGFHYQEGSYGIEGGEIIDCSYGTNFGVNNYRIHFLNKALI